MQSGVRVKYVEMNEANRDERGLSPAHVGAGRRLCHKALCAETWLMDRLSCSVCKVIKRLLTAALKTRGHE